jgi:hypothetical protein
MNCCGGSGCLAGSGSSRFAAGAAGLDAAGAAAGATTIAYSSQGASASHIWVMRGDGALKERLTSGAYDDVSPALSPAGVRSSSSAAAWTAATSSTASTPPAAACGG